MTQYNGYDIQFYNCGTCGTHWLRDYNKATPPFGIRCPGCGGEGVSFIWINDPSMYFKEENGYFVGYHIEDTDVEHPLTLETLDNDKILYLCANPVEWYSYHLPKHTELFRVLEVKFKAAPIQTTRSMNEYRNYADGVDDRYLHKPSVVVLPRTKSHDDISEAFISKPKELVVSIKEVPFIKPEALIVREQGRSIILRELKNMNDALILKEDEQLYHFDKDKNDFVPIMERRTELPMSRINCIPPSELNREMLQGEYHELPRIMNLVRSAIKRGETPNMANYPKSYTLGLGHVRFFYPRLKYILKRYTAIVKLCKEKNIDVKYTTLDMHGIGKEWFGDWEPTQEDMDLNRERIMINLKRKRFSKFFKNNTERIKYALLYTNGDHKEDLLGIDKVMYVNKTEARSWYRNVLSFLKPETTDESLKAQRALKDIYDVMLDHNFGGEKND